MLKQPRHGHSDGKQKITIKEKKKNNHLKLVQTRQARNAPYIPARSQKESKAS